MKTRQIALACLAALPLLCAAAETVVVVKAVEELDVGEPVVVNGVIRSRSDILLPATVDGELRWVQEEGALVKVGEVVAKIEDETLLLQRAEQQLLADRATINLNYLQQEVDRLTELQRSNMASRTQLAEMTSRRDFAKNDLAVAQARLAQLDESISRTSIVSPVGAVVVERTRQGGEFARRGEGVVRVVDPFALEVIAAIPVSNLGRVRNGQAVRVAALNVEFEARLKSIVMVSDRSSQTFNVLIDVPAETAGLIAAGQFAEVSVPLSADGSSLFVPRDAIVLRSDGNYVYRIDDDNIAHRVTVTLGVGQGDLVSVTGELNAGDKVAVRGVERLSHGQVVTQTNS